MFMDIIDQLGCRIHKLFNLQSYHLERQDLWHEDAEDILEKLLGCQSTLELWKKNGCKGSGCGHSL